MYGYTYTSYTAHDREVWAARMADALLTATRFTVHCWHEETAIGGGTSSASRRPGCRSVRTMLTNVLPLSIFG